MTQTQPVVVTGGSVEGNIGSCEIKTSSISLDSFHTQTMAVNSCTGEVISTNQYYDWGHIYFPAVIIIIALVFAATMRS